MEGFSIREYASRMRSVDVVKCWPFDVTIRDETVKSLLPPITVKKFTWWLHELECLDSKSAPVDINNSKNKNKKLNEKGKGKITKKRSIVELFAVAPQVEKVVTCSDEDAEEDEEDYGFSNFQHGSTSHDQEINWVVKGKRNFKKNKANKKEKEILLSELKKTNKLIKKPKKKTLNKEHHSKLTLHHHDKAMGTLNSSHCEESENEIFNHLSIHKRKPNLQHSDADKIATACADSKLIAENENPRLFGSDVLNNPATEFIIEQPTQCFLQENVPENHPGKQKVMKNLNFSENDDILSLRRKDCGLGLEVVNYAPSVEKDSSVVETNGIRDFSRCPPVSFKEYLETYNEFPILSQLSSSEKQETEAVQASSGSGNIPFHDETLPYLAHEELLQNLLSLRRGTICGERIINGMDKDFVGLPLNSQGELIALNSSSNQMMKSSINVRSSGDHRTDFWNWDCRSHSKDHLNPFLIEHMVKEDPLSVIPAGPNITKLHGNRIDLDLDLLKISDSSKFEKSQSTMRLMGKEFPIGGRSFQGFEDERTWKDRQIMDKIQFGSRSIDTVIMHDWNERSLNKQGETLFPPYFTTNLQSESRYFVPHFDLRASLMHENGFAKRQFNEDYPEIRPSTFNAVYDHESLFQDPIMYGCDQSQVSISMHPTATTSYQISHPYVSSSAIPIQNTQNLHVAPRFPFMHPGIEGHARSFHSSSSMNSYDVSEKEIFMRNSGTYWNFGSSHHHPRVAMTESSMSLRPEVFCMHDLVPSASTLHRPISTVSPMLTKRAVMPCYSGFEPISAIQERNGNQKKTRNLPNIGVRGCGGGKKPKRQHFSVSNFPRNPFKSHGLGVQEGPQCAKLNPITPLAEAAPNLWFFEPENSEKIYRF